MNNSQEQLDIIAKEVREFLLGNKSIELDNYLNGCDYIYRDIQHLGTYTIAKIILSTTEMYFNLYHKDINSESLFSCLIYNLISMDIVQFKQV